MKYSHKLLFSNENKFQKDLDDSRNQKSALTYHLGEKEARRPTPKWNTRFYLAFSIRA